MPKTSSAEATLTAGVRPVADGVVLAGPGPDFGVRAAAATLPNRCATEDRTSWFEFSSARKLRAAIDSNSLSWTVVGECRKTSHRHYGKNIHQHKLIQ